MIMRIACLAILVCDAWAMKKEHDSHNTHLGGKFMIKYCLNRWNENHQKLRQQLETDTSLNGCDYKYLVELVTKFILGKEWDAENITVVDNGDYQGTQLFLIPEDTYQPSESEYLMTYVGYGSCSGCDTLQAIQGWSLDDRPLDPDQVEDFMKLCKDLVTNMIRPYNIGWRASSDFEPVEFDK